jgi:hypothetical protein
MSSRDLAILGVGCDGTTYRWAQPVMVREQITLFQPTLDDMIPQDH